MGGSAYFNFVAGFGVESGIPAYSGYKELSLSLVFISINSMLSVVGAILVSVDDTYKYSALLAALCVVTPSSIQALRIIIHKKW